MLHTQKQHAADCVVYCRTALAVMPEEQRQDSESDFQPNLVNSVCYLVEQIVQLGTFAVNYVGHPFNSSLKENTGMARSLRYGSCFLALLVSEIVPQVNERWVQMGSCL